MAYRNRVISAVLIVVACSMLDGCATVKKMVPWGGSDSDTNEATPVESKADTRTDADDGNAKMKPADDGGRSSSNAPSSNVSTAPVDLSVPRVQRDQPAIADSAKSDAATDAGSARGARENSVPPQGDPGSEVSAGADDWGRAVQQAIHSRWVQPRGPKIPTEFSCDVMVKLTPFGGVDDVKVVRSCGDVALDASIETAVRESSPLPTPEDPADFSESLLLTFTPR